jgi:hypothetical protein
MEAKNFLNTNKYWHMPFFVFQGKRVALLIEKQKTKNEVTCIIRKSNPGPNDGNVGFYH